MIVSCRSRNDGESINGLSLPASPALIALNPATRTGFVWVAPSGTELQGFNY